MTFSLKHTFTSPKADGTDATLVQPSNWNAEHTITLAAGKVLGRDASGTGAVQELPLAFDATGQSMIPPSGTTASRPATPLAGMVRYNTTTSKFELYNGTAWGSVGGGASISDTAPTSPQAGDLWWKSDEGQMYVYYTDVNSSQWVISNTFAGGAAYLPLTGGTVSGTLSVSGALSVAGSLGVAAYTETTVAIGTVTTTSTLNIANGTVLTATLTASTACTFTMPTAVSGKSFVLLLKQAVTTGNGSATFTGVKWNSAGAPTITVTAAKMDVLSFVSDGINWYGSYIQGYTP